MFQIQHFASSWLSVAQWLSSQLLCKRGDDGNIWPHWKKNLLREHTCTEDFDMWDSASQQRVLGSMETGLRSPKNAKATFEIRARPQHYIAEQSFQKIQNRKIKFIKKYPKSFCHNVGEWCANWSHFFIVLSSGNLMQI